MFPLGNIILSGTSPFRFREIAAERARQGTKIDPEITRVR
jgi:hypothetical protein